MQRLKEESEEKKTQGDRLGNNVDQYVGSMSIFLRQHA